MRRRLCFKQKRHIYFPSTWCETHSFRAFFCPYHIVYTHQFGCWGKNMGGRKDKGLPVQSYPTLKSWCSSLFLGGGSQDCPKSFSVVMWSAWQYANGSRNTITFTKVVPVNLLAFACFQSRRPQIGSSKKLRPSPVINLEDSNWFLFHPEPLVSAHVWWSLSVLYSKTFKRKQVATSAT